MTRTVQLQKKLGRPLGADVAVATRIKIIDAATLCFAELGYAEASNREISRRAGITSGSLYHYFDSKAALYRAALQDANRILIEAYHAAAAEAPEASSVDQLCLGLERAFAAAHARPGMMNFAAASAMEIQRNRELDWLEKDEAEAFQNYFRRLLKRARRRGELGARVDIEAAVNILLITFASLAFLHGSQVGAQSGEQAFAASLAAFKQLLKGQLFARNS
ncbi:MAG: TetR/AcrR family transcriptional regulator [Nevskiales bacterium]